MIWQLQCSAVYFQQRLPGLFFFFFPHKVLEENGEQVPCYSVMVSLQEVGGAETKNWTVPRKLSEFQNLHRKLSEVRIQGGGEDTNCQNLSEW